MRGQAIAEQDQALGLRGAEKARRAHGSARAREDADPDLREAEHGALVGDSEVGRERELEAAAEAVAVDRGERRLRQRRELLVDVSRLAVVAQDRLRVAVGELGDVGAGGERAARSGDHDGAARPHVVGGERVAQLALHRGRDRVQLLVAVELDHRDRAVAFDCDETHRSTSLISAAAASARSPTSSSRSRGSRCSVPHTLTIATGRPCSESTGADAPKSDSSSSPTHVA